jgi:hypothetical protein
MGVGINRLETLGLSQRDASKKKLAGGTAIHPESARATAAIDTQLFKAALIRKDELDYDNKYADNAEKGGTMNTGRSGGSTLRPGRMPK